MKIVLIIILGLVVYLNALKGDFIWDDECVIKNNISIRSWSNVSKVFATDMGMGGRDRFIFYRPLQLFSYFIDYSIWKLNPIGYHLTNILLHILVALTLCWLVNIIYSDAALSLLAAALFVVHPIHTEAVAYISGRGDALAVLFMLLCFIFYIKGKKLYILMLLSYALSLLSKENALILPVLLLVYHYAFKKNFKREFLSIIGLAFIYVLLRMTLLKAALPHALYFTTSFRRIPAFFAAITNYTRLILLPFGLHMEYGDKLFKLVHPRAIIGIALLVSFLIYAFKMRDRSNVTFFSITWFFTSLLPFSNIYPLPFYMAEHYLYLSSMGFFLILAKGLRSIYNDKNVRGFAAVLTTVLLVFYSLLTIRQNEYWKDPVTLYNRILRYEPDSSRVHYNLGITYYNLDKKAAAMNSFKKAIEIDPNFAYAYNNLGVIYKEMDNKEEAIALFKRIIEIDPSYMQAYANLCSVYVIMGRIDKAIDLYKNAGVASSDAEIYNKIGLICRANSRNEEAVKLFKKAREIDLLSNN